MTPKFYHSNTLESILTWTQTHRPTGLDFQVDFKTNKCLYFSIIDLNSTTDTHTRTQTHTHTHTHIYTYLYIHISIIILYFVLYFLTMSIKIKIFDTIHLISKQ